MPLRVSWWQFTRQLRRWGQSSSVKCLQGGLGGPSSKYRYLPQAVAITASIRPPGATPVMMNKVSLRQRMCR